MQKLEGIKSSQFSLVCHNLSTVWTFQNIATAIYSMVVFNISDITECCEEIIRKNWPSPNLFRVEQLKTLFCSPTPPHSPYTCQLRCQHKFINYVCQQRCQHEFINHVHQLTSDVNMNSYIMFVNGDVNIN